VTLTCRASGCLLRVPESTPASGRPLFALRTISEFGGRRGGEGADDSRSFKRQEERIMAELETSDEW
jgi:hypothetical protein